MRWFSLAALGALALLMMGMSPAQRPQSHTSGGVLQTPVEQQTPGGASQPDRSLWVVNPFRDIGALWDADDHWTESGYDPRLVSGEQLTETGWVVGDSFPHVWRVTFQGQQGRTYSWGISAGALTLSGVGADATTLCVWGPDYDAPVEDNPFLFPIPDSNGGVGVLTPIQAVLWNTDSRAQKDARLTLTGTFAHIPAWVAVLCGSHPNVSPQDWSCVGAPVGADQPRWCWRSVD